VVLPSSFGASCLSPETHSPRPFSSLFPGRNVHSQRGWLHRVLGSCLKQASNRMLKKSASLSRSFGLFGLSGWFGCMRLTRRTRQTGLVQDVRTIEVLECQNCFSAACWKEGPDSRLDNPFVGDASICDNGDRVREVHHLIILIIRVEGQSPDIMCVNLDDIVFLNRCFHSGVLSLLVLSRRLRSSRRGRLLASGPKGESVKRRASFLARVCAESGTR